MKKLVLLFVSVLLSSTFVNAQDDCMAFFPTTKGATLVNKSYDANNVLLNTITYIITDSYVYESGADTQANFTIVDANGKMIDRGIMDASCIDGTFYLKMANKAMSPDVIGVLGNNTELVGAYLDYPDTFNDAVPFNGTFKMSGGEYTIQDKLNKKESVRVRIFNRKYEKNEKVTTPAGTFDASKISFTFENTKDKKTTTFKGIEWYSIGAGIVRSETYDANNKLVSYSVITYLKDK